MGSQTALHDREYRAFVARLREARLEAGLTQVEAAKLLRRSQSYVSKCELGERRVDAVEFAKFCRAYNMPVTFFFPRVPTD